ncbi:molybdenum cofactor guanylyltransferase [Alteromonas sp. DY56-G5]|uniref:MobA-like NTP transferase domain protein n=2 Tax=Alteromonas macleodii TaxID=28108 RepID=A0AB36FV76_ALTMA|nr:molybdenum cofactor guanylyltransferase [Alteromonas macleodii]MEC8966944.1 molybdenum cofactor guanylyltransferase [Pseudomonadota bacterium]AFT74273.1 molybdopterin guanine dinucleotide synthase [Alteromonas macleodii str. 'English Channel 673']MEE3028214.1 molybdenum cofactor guanylyltransferase [Pseudomonadota bacterium]OES33080.1 mobA-like NTP transferase domain protein [Alteromonas macleodii]OES35408.1 mobA-like NTP transferase domain protein [Alteromonas macleodii]
MSKVNTTLIGLVLAGGQSRRMGQDKALMRYQGRTLIDNASLLLQSASCDKVLISRNAPGFLNDKIEDAGPLSGVHAVLDALSQSDNHNGNPCELLVLPVDMPQMTPELLRILVSRGREAEKACYVEKRFLPFYLPVTQDTKALLANYLVEQSKRRVVGFLEILNAVSLKEAGLKKTARKDESDSKANMSNDDDVEWLNVNTPGDWPHEK